MKKKKYPYTYEEFERHFADYSVVRQYRHVARQGEQVEVGDSKSFEVTVLRVMDYMRQIYPNEEEAQQKTNMFILIQMYLAEHAQEFDQGDLAVLGSEEGLASRHLLRAVHHLYTSRPLSKFKRGPSPKEVIALATKYAKEPDQSS
jgi:hypothetical protein